MKDINSASADGDKDHCKDSYATRLYAQIFSPNGSPEGEVFVNAVNAGPDPKGHRLTMLALASVCWRDFV